MFSLNLLLSNLISSTGFNRSHKFFNLPSTFPPNTSGTLLCPLCLVWHCSYTKQCNNYIFSVLLIHTTAWVCWMVIFIFWLISDLICWPVCLAWQSESSHGHWKGTMPMWSRHGYFLSAEDIPCWPSASGNSGTRKSHPACIA